MDWTDVIQLMSIDGIVNRLDWTNQMEIARF
jgi:hypothetical protein